MVEFEAGLKFFDLQGLAEFPSKDCLDADGVARLDEDRDRFHRQETARACNPLRQSLLVSGDDLEDIGRQLRIVDALHERPAQGELLAPVVAVARQDEIGLVFGGLHRLLPPVDGLFQADARGAGEGL